MKHTLMLTGLLGATLIIGFQNCSQVSFGSNDTLEKSGVTVPNDPPNAIGDLPICEGVSCELTPLTTKPAVSTILLALGDEENDQLVVNAVSAQFIAESIIRYSSPITNPKILLIHDSNSGSESPDDYAYTAQLLKRYNVVEINEPAGGMSVSDFKGYDVVWLNNPGNPMGSSKTRDALIAFSGGVVIQGDDMSWGVNFDNSALTGLTMIDNGTSVVCDDGKTYNHDNNSGSQYWVNLDPSQLTGSNSSALQFRYGNDIDNTVPARADLQILASAKGGPDTCTKTRPAVVRYVK